MADDENLTVNLFPEGKRLFGLEKAALYRAAANGDIPAIKIGGVWRVPLRAVEEMYAELGRRTAERQAAKQRTEPTAA